MWKYDNLELKCGVCRAKLAKVVGDAVEEAF